MGYNIWTCPLYEMWMKLWKRKVG